MIQEEGSHIGRRLTPGDQLCLFQAGQEVIEVGEAGLDDLIGVKGGVPDGVQDGDDSHLPSLLEDPGRGRAVKPGQDEGASHVQDAGLLDQREIDVFVDQGPVGSDVVEEAPLPVGGDHDKGERGVGLLVPPHAPDVNPLLLQVLEDEISEAVSPHLTHGPRPQAQSGQADGHVVGAAAGLQLHVVNQGQLSPGRHALDGFGQSVGHEDAQAENIQGFVLACHVRTLPQCRKRDRERILRSLHNPHFTSCPSPKWMPLGLP